MNKCYLQKRKYFQNPLNKEILTAQEAFAQQVKELCNTEPEEAYGKVYHNINT